VNISLLRTIVVFLSSLQLLACGQVQEKKETLNESIAQHVSATEFHQIYAERGGKIVDVRTEGELELGYIPNANHIDFYSNSFKEELAELDMSKPVFVYCAGGNRSGKAMKIMASMGFEEVYNLTGGFQSWKAAGLEIQK